MHDMMAAQIRIAVNLERAKVEIIQVIKDMASKYSSPTLPKEEVEAELMDLMNTCITYGKFEEFQQNNLYGQKQEKKEGENP